MIIRKQNNANNANMGKILSKAYAPKRTDKRERSQNTNRILPHLF